MLLARHFPWSRILKRSPGWPFFIWILLKLDSGLKWMGFRSAEWICLVVWGCWASNSSVCDLKTTLRQDCVCHSRPADADWWQKTSGKILKDLHSYILILTLALFNIEFQQNIWISAAFITIKSNICDISSMYIHHFMSWFVMDKQYFPLCWLLQQGQQGGAWATDTLMT